MTQNYLYGFERVSVPVLTSINTNLTLKDGINSTIGRFNTAWISRATGRLWRVFGEEHLRGLAAPHGLIIASNHRTLFDLYPCTVLLMQRYPGLMRRLYCPVRSNFFYTNPLGLFMNVVGSGASLWPPIFRDERRELNMLSLKQLSTVLQNGTCVGFHPEGTRGKPDQDPYDLLPAKPGLGILLSMCHPETVVLPYFTLGMSNDLLSMIRRNYRPSGQRGEIVSLRFGAPLTAGSLASLGALEATNAVMARISALGYEDRAMREVCRTT